MASAVFSSVQPSIFSRTHIPIPISKDSFEEFGHSINYKHYFRSNPCGQKKRVAQVKATLAEATAAPPAPSLPSKKLRILVAGGGIGGLVLALAAKKKGFDVVVFEKDMSAIRGEGQYRGPIQIQSNALAALEAVDMEVAEEVMRAGCITGDRINGLVDGVSGDWYVKFDTFTPAAERGLPVTRVISRMTLQQILARAVGEDIIMNGSNVVDFEDDGNKVTVILENGQRYEGDLLIGADGIWSKVRKSLFGPKEATYSGYTCYTGIADFVPADIDTVGYRVFLGHKQYFVSSDVGAGKMQWYAFYNEPAGGVDGPEGKKERLLKIFGGWCDNVIDLILATDEEAILRRDIYDRTPTFTWGRGRVTLLGDSVHAMQPNMGQGVVPDPNSPLTSTPTSSIIPDSSSNNFTMSSTEQTFIAIKPDGVQRGLIGPIISRFENRGFKLAAIKLVTPGKEHLEAHYADLSDKPFFAGLVQYMNSGPICAMVWEGRDAVKTGRSILGATNPLASAPGTIRGDFAIDVGRNVCHGSDSVENAKKEIALWFKEGEVLSWKSAQFDWVYEKA